MLSRRRSVTHSISCDKIHDDLSLHSGTRNRRSDATSVNVRCEPPDSCSFFMALIVSSGPCCTILSLNSPAYFFA